jgi:hypothetical protein
VRKNCEKRERERERERVERRARGVKREIRAR